MMKSLILTLALLLSATVGNSVEFVGWLRKNHDRRLELVQSDERKVPLTFHWVADKLLGEQLEEMAAGAEPAGHDDAHRPGVVAVARLQADVPLDHVELVDRGVGQDHHFGLARRAEELRQAFIHENRRPRGNAREKQQQQHREDQAETPGPAADLWL
mgnify:CR=1 FL=1